MKTYLLNAHAGKYSHTHEFRIPANTRLFFYTDATGYITDSKCVTVYDALMIKKPIFPSWIRNPNDNMPNLGCWDLERDDYVSGVIRRATEKPIIDLKGVKVENPVSLREIVNIMSNRSTGNIEIHCIICRYSTGLPGNFTKAAVVQKIEQT